MLGAYEGGEFCDKLSDYQLVHGAYFLGASAKLPKAAISFVMFARASVRMEELGSHWTDFHEI